MNRPLQLSLIWGILCVCGVQAQTPLAIGEWTDLLPFNQGNAITQSEDFAFIGCPGGLLRLTKSDSTFRFITKVDGLSDFEPSFLEYDESRNELFIVYENSNIDLITEDRNLNFPDILLNSSILAGKEVNDLFLGETSAYIALGFGLVEFNLDQRLFGSTVFTDEPVLSVLESGENIWIGLGDGVYRVRRVQNISDFSLWQKIPFGLDEFEGASCDQLVEWNGQILALVNGKILSWNGQEWTRSDILQSLTLRNIRAENNQLWTIQDCSSCPNSVRRYDSNGDEFIYNTSCVGRPLDALDLTNSGETWFIDRGDAIHFNDSEGNCKEFRPNRPETAEAFRVFAKDGQILIASGAIVSPFGNLFVNRGIYHRLDGDWSFIGPRNDARLKDQDNIDFFDFVAVEYSEERNAYYFATFWEGVVEWFPETDSLNIYNDDNSPIGSSIRDGRTRISDLKMDDDGNLWVTNFESNQPLSVFTADGRWYSFEIPTSRSPRVIEVDPSGLVYVGLTDRGLTVLDPGTIENPNDDRWTTIPVREDGLPNNNILSLARDADGNILVGTSDGVSVISCSGGPECVVDRPIVAPTYLLQSERVQAIAVDGGNQKWYGTENGLFLYSEDNREQLQQYNVDNSPLINNGIIDVAIDPSDGLVYISTSEGISVLRGEATQGQRFHPNEATVFPNPVNPNYHGPITIKGLTDNAFVKILTISGRLVHEGRSIGGQFLWDGLDQDGGEVSSGVYLVYSLNDASTQGTDDGLVAKIIMVR